MQYLFAKKDTYLSCVGQNSHRHEGCASLVACLYRQLISTEICLQQPSLVGLKHISHGFALISVSSSSMTSIQVLTSTISRMLGWVQTGYTPTLLAWYSTALAPLQLYWVNFPMEAGKFKNTLPGDLLPYTVHSKKWLGILPWFGTVKKPHFLLLQNRVALKVSFTIFFCGFFFNFAFKFVCFPQISWEFIAKLVSGMITLLFNMHYFISYAVFRILYICM